MIVLVVDDMEDDLKLASMAFRKTAPEVITRFVQGGEDALAYMTGKGKYLDRNTHPLPKLILLDLKMPRVDGFDVLQQVRQMELRDQPYITILTSSNLSQDVERAKLLGADLFETKPGDFDGLCEMLGKITSFFGCAGSRGSNMREAY
jgi:CheY-like chemotaxis protein